MYKKRQPVILQLHLVLLYSEKRCIRIQRNILQGYQQHEIGEICQRGIKK